MAQPTFLIVDDDAVLRLVLRRTLTCYDPHAIIFSAASVAEARQHLTHTSPHIIITDYHFTDGTALDVLATLQAHTPVPTAVVISVDISCTAAALAAGAAAFLPKPFTPTNLIELLQTFPQIARCR